MSDTSRPTAPKTPEEITADVLASFDGAPDARLREIMQALVRHLHGFVLEVGLTPTEWEGAIGALTRTGHITDERRQEFILWSDSLGVSMLVDAIENTVPAGATESTVQGPFYVPGSPLREYGANIAEEPDAGVPALVHGRVLDLNGDGPSPAPRSTCGRTATTSSTRCSVTTRLRSTSAAASSPARTAATRSWPSAPRRTRSPTTARWAGCSTSPDATRGAPPTCT